MDKIADQGQIDCEDSAFDDNTVDLISISSEESASNSSGAETVISDNTVVGISDNTITGMTELKRYHIHRLNGKNFHLWKRQMEIYMNENGMKKYILGTEIRQNANSVVWDKKDAEAQSFLTHGLELDQLRYLNTCNTAAEMWSRLHTVHSQKSDQSVQVLLDQFINARMEEGTEVKEYLAHMESLIKRLSDLGMEQKEPVIIAKILGSLSSVFDNIRATWYAEPKAEQTYNKLAEHLVSEEALMKLRVNGEEKQSEDALIAKGKQNQGRGRGRNEGGKRNTPNPTREQASGENHQFSTEFNKRRGKCNYCQVPGHFGRECPEKNKNWSRVHDFGGQATGNWLRNGQSYGSSGNWQRRGNFFGNAPGFSQRGNRSYGRSFMAQGMVPDNPSEYYNNYYPYRANNFQGNFSYNPDQSPSDKPHALTVDTEASSNNKRNCSWFADSGATEHMCFRREWFKQFIPYSEKTYSVRVGDGSKIEVEGKGVIDVQTLSADGNLMNLTLIDVLYVLKIEKNLISISKATSRGNF